MSQKDQPSINYPVCVIDQTDELRTDFKIAIFFNKTNSFSFNPREVIPKII